jgi:lysophospholipase L1-like esterase
MSKLKPYHMTYPFKIFIAFIVLLFLNFNCDETSNEIENSTTMLIQNSIYPDSDLVIPTHSEFTRTHYPERIEEFKENPLVTGDIVFLGNSITEQAGDWSFKVNNPKARNRGISGDTTDGVLARLGELIYYKPVQIFILIGINDLFRDDMSSEKVFETIVQIVNNIHNGSPETEIFVQTILPTTTENLKEKILLTNDMLINSENSEPYEIISLPNLFTTDSGLMNMELSTDGVHLNENGYTVWVDNITNLIHN